MDTALRTTIRFATAVALLGLSACGVPSQYLNPFHPETPPEAYLGQANDNALYASGDASDKARAKLEQVAQSQPAHTASPYRPVMKPAIVRLMWIPDHLNSHGDLVPAHYYYLKVKGEQWNVSDAFELEKQLNTGPGGSPGGLPFVYGR